MTADPRRPVTIDLGRFRLTYPAMLNDIDIDLLLKMVKVAAMSPRIDDDVSDTGLWREPWGGEESK